MTCIFGSFFRQLADDYLTAPNIFWAAIAFSWLSFLWENYLSFRQYRVCQNTDDVPSELAGVMDRDTLTKARNYNMDKTRFGFVYGLWSQIVSTVVLVKNVLPWLWTLSGQILARFGYGPDAEITQTIVFALIGSLASVIIDLPWSVYSNFVVEERHGFNKYTAGFYAKDKLKKFVISQALITPILAAAIYIIKTGGDYFFIYLWLFCFVVTIVLMAIYPDFIAPLFDKFTLLEPGDLRTRIEKLASSIDFPLTKIFVVEGSKRSAHSNAYFFGFYKNKRIVLFDTLIEDYHKKQEQEVKEEEVDEIKKKEEHKKTGCNTDEIVGVLAHELGHWKLNHIWKNLVIVEANLFFCFMVFAFLYKNSTLYHAFGFTEQQPVFIGIFIIFQYIFSPYNEVVSFLMTCLSRRFEFGADHFAKQLNQAASLRGALIKLHKDNLSFPVYDWLYSSWTHSHPPILERIRALGKFD